MLRFNRVWSKKKDTVETQLARLGRCLDRGLEAVHDLQEKIRPHVEAVRQVATTLDPTTGSADQRQETFHALQQTWAQDPDPIRQHMAKTMNSFRPGLFVGEEGVASENGL